MKRTISVTLATLLLAAVAVAQQGASLPAGTKVVTDETDADSKKNNRKGF